MKPELTIAEINNKFLVLSGGQPIKIPKTDGASVVSIVLGEFDNKQDAERYISMLRSY
jgi:hypothetical protein